MGELYADDRQKPSSVMAILGDFCFLAGRPQRELALYKPSSCRQNFIIMVPQNEEWARMIEECYTDRARRVSRYAIAKEPDVFVEERLRRAAESLPEGVSLQRIDEGLYHWCKEHDWSRDFVSQYADYETFLKYGLGVVAVKDGSPVSGASSYSSYPGGIEIEVDTRQEYRRQGLAYACCAKLILECRKRGWYPSWDAQNRGSAELAKKLGYHESHEYTAYEIWGY